MSTFKYQWNQTIDVGTAGLLSKQWTSIRHILSLLVTANACVHVTAYVAVRRSLSTTYTAVVLGLLLRQYVSYQFGVWAESSVVAIINATHYSYRTSTHTFHHCIIHTFMQNTTVWNRSWEMAMGFEALYAGRGRRILCDRVKKPIGH